MFLDDDMGDNEFRLIRVHKKVQTQRGDPEKDADEEEDLLV